MPVDSVNSKATSPSSNELSLRPVNSMVSRNSKKAYSSFNPTSRRLRKPTAGSSPGMTSTNCSCEFPNPKTVANVLRYEASTMKTRHRTCEKED